MRAGLISAAKQTNPMWPVLSIAEQIESAIAYQERVNSEFAQRYVNGGRGKAYAAQKAYMHERCCIALDAIAQSPDGLTLVDIAEVIGLLPNSVAPVGRALVAKDAPYGVIRERVRGAYRYRCA